MKAYSIGLDIGTNSVGWAVMTDDLKLVRKNMKVLGNTDKKRIKKNFWGVRLFDSGETADATRMKRTTRRRLRRRKNRIKYLQEIFQDELNALDENFLFRLSESFYVPEDKSNSKYPIFGTIEDEVNYHNNFPTIYHLRKHLADSNEKADLRLVYLALHHIIKYRGHFLIEGEINTDNISLKENFSEFIEIYNNLFEESIHIDEDKLSAIENVLTEKVSRSKKAENMRYILGLKTTHNFSEFIKLIVGLKSNMKKVFELEEKTDLELTKETYDSDLEELLSVIGDEYREVFDSIKLVYDAMELSGILKESTSKTKAPLSNGMIDYYEQHGEDLQRLKTQIRKHTPELYFDMFNNEKKNGYAGYIDGKTTQEDFYKYLNKELKSLPDYDYFVDKMDREELFRKQRSFYNGSIPHQVHLNELRAIIAQQGQYYPFLLEHKNKIEQIFRFRIPYYVGPLTQNDEQSNFSWLERYSDESIRPWNFDEVVDRKKSAIDFIDNLINYCQYLPDEKVLPKRSLLYQKYTIFNELTKVSYIDERGMQHRFSGDVKKAIFENLFKRNNRVTIKKLKEFLEQEYNLEVQEIRGIENSFNSNYSTYHDLIKIDGLKEVIDDEENAVMIEDIIRLITVFEDKNMLQTQLQKYNDVLTKKQIKKLARKHYTGWGRLSAKLIDGIRDKESHKSILDYLMNDDGVSSHPNRNLMQLINDDLLSFKQIIADNQNIEKLDNYKKIVEDLAGSPAIKKGILQSLKIVDEIVEIMGYAPKTIVVEMARENQTTGQGRARSNARLNKLKEGLKEFGSQLLKEYPVENAALQTDRLYLYYLQNGKDMYTGEFLDINKLSHYDIDHIIPQSITVDNSIDNKVLVSASENRGMSDNVPSINIVNKQKTFWESLHKSGLISDRKLSNLTKAERGGLSEKEKERFLKRQLVETRQITKHVANILDTRFNTQDENEVKLVDIVTLKSALTSQFRKEFGIYKVREINDYHHGHDAYLNAVVANKLLKVYPDLRREFVYGEFKYYRSVSKYKATDKKRFMTNIMKFFKNSDRLVSEHGEILWDKAEDIKTVKQVLSSKQMNIVKKPEIQSGTLFKETLYPKGNSNKLIPIKGKLDTSKYGGYMYPKVAYTVLFTHGNNKKEIYGLYIDKRKDFEANPIEFLEAEGYKNPDNIIKLPKYSLYEREDGTRRILSSNLEAQKGNQFILSNHLVPLIHHMKQYDEIRYPDSFKYVQENINLVEDVFYEIIEFSERYIHKAKNVNKVINLFNENKASKIEDKIESTIELFKYTNFGAPEMFKFFNEKIERARYLGINEIWESTLIFHSVTGLYETRVNLSDLS